MYINDKRRNRDQVSDAETGLPGTWGKMVTCGAGFVVSAPWKSAKERGTRLVYSKKLTDPA